MRHPPPRLAETVLRTLFPDEVSETRLGDLEEVYHHIGMSEGYARARRWYWMQLVRAFLPSLSERLAWTLVMLKNYLHTTFRHLRRHTLYTTINVFGLSVALMLAILAYLFIHSEMTYDRFHPEYDQIYRVGTAIYFDGLDTWENTPFPLADELETSVPGIVQATRLTSLPNRLLRLGDQRVETDIHLVDASFFDLFSFALTGGADPALMDEPNTVILSDAARARYFGAENPVGQTLDLSLQTGALTSFTVAGVTEPIPENSSIAFDILISDAHYRTAFGEEALTDWFPKSRTATFFKTTPEANLATIQTALNGISEAHGLDRFLAGNEVAEKLPIERLDQIHFSTRFTNRILRPAADPAYAYILGGVALLILLIAGINFMNLAVGMSASRAREVGMRKVLGAHRGQLMSQFWSEAIVLTLVSLGLGIGLAAGLLPTFNALAGKALTLQPYLTLDTAGVLVGMALLLGLIAGSYPALVLSSFRPVAVLKGKLRLGSRSRFGQSIMVFQFAVSVFLIACTLVMARQLRHVSQLDLGYDAEWLVLQELPQGADQALVDRYREAALQNPNIVGVTGTRATLFGESINSALMVEHEGERFTLPASKIDEAFLDVLNLPLAAGRNFSPDHPSDEREAVLVNEAFVRKFGIADPVGKPLPFGIDDQAEPVIVGVVQDYHFLSLHEQIGPHLLYMRPDSDYRQLITRVRGGDVAGTLAFLDRTWNALDTDMLFEYAFLDEVIAAQYRTEQNFRIISRYAAALAMLIACLGLFGLTALSVIRRTKEMGIRKVLGATGPRLLLLFNKEFFALLLLGTLVAWPAAYYLMHTWLQRFAYRIDLGPAPFVVAALLVVGLAMLTITLQALKAIRANPADTLRHE